MTRKYICPVHNIEQVKEEDVANIKDVKPPTVEKVVDDNWCRMCSGSNLHRKVFGEDHSKYPPAPLVVKKPSTDKEDTVVKKEVKKGPGIWCSVCKGFDLHRKVYEWPPREEEIEDSSNDDDDSEWCPMCKGFKMHRKLYGEDYNDYPNPPYKPKKDKNDKGVYCPYCKGFNVHRIVYDWPILG